MTSLRLRLVLPALLLASLLCASSAAEERPPARLVLNDGENIHVSLIAASEDVLIITHGRARRVFVPARDENAPGGVELDVVGRNITVRTSVSRIFISGAKTAEIAGVTASCWGSFEAPAVYIDRDCRVTLKGRAARRAVVEAHPLAIATVDARQLDTGEIVIVGNPGTKVLCRPGTKVSFLGREGVPVTRTSGSAGDWLAAPDIAPSAPVPPPAAAPPPAPGQERAPGSE